MGDEPSGPWRTLDPGETPTPLGVYEAAPHLFKYATLYRAVAVASGGSIGPDVVDGWESWQCAAFLGVGLPLPDEAAPGSFPGPVSSGRDLNRERMEYLAARADAEAAGLDPDAIPEPPPLDPAALAAETASVMSALGGPGA